VTARPYVLLSAAMSVDGYLDDTSASRLLLSNVDDFAEVAALRAGVDAILVGATTLRRDDPRLLATPQPIKVTLTSSGSLDPAARFFTTGSGLKLVYTTDPAVSRVSAALGCAATVVGAGDPVELDRVLADLSRRGVARLLVEGGTSVHTAFLTAGLADELRLAVAPVFVGQSDAPRFVGAGAFANGPSRRMTLAGVRQVGDMAVLRYLPGPSGPVWTEQDVALLGAAVELAGACPPSSTAFSVGALIAAADGRVLATGHSRETGPTAHAEEAALSKVDPEDPALGTATLYSSLEPCAVRASRPVSCAAHIIASAIPRVVFAWREPMLLADGDGASLLRAAGREVVEISDLAPAARIPNAHLLPR